MADWRDVAKREGWQAFSTSVRVRLGARKQAVQIRDHGGLEYEFYSEVPSGQDPDQLVALLMINRNAGLAYWHVEDGRAWATSMCPKRANPKEMAAYLLDTAALADRLELRLSEVDRY